MYIYLNLYIIKTNALNFLMTNLAFLFKNIQKSVMKKFKILCAKEMAREKREEIETTSATIQRDILRFSFLLNVILLLWN